MHRNCCASSVKMGKKKVSDEVVGTNGKRLLNILDR